MRYIESKEQSAELLRLTLPLMVRQAAAYHPVSYTLWYEHVAGINPTLSTALAARLKSDEPLTDKEVYRLYVRHISERDAAVLDNLQHRLQQVLDETAQTFNTAGEDTGHFSRALRESRADLSDETSVTQVQRVISRLLSEALRMESMTQVLAEKLEGRTREVKTLTEQLHQAQVEALLDPLCGICNRRGFLRQVKALADASHGLHGSALLLADVDHFKQINDRYGHLLGDKVLRSIAGVFGNNVQDGEIAARIGGEEFALLLPQRTLRGAQMAAERIRTAVARGRIYREDAEEIIGAITISLGVAVGEAGETIDMLMRRADRALYAAKCAGRNQVCTESSS